MTTARMLLTRLAALCFAAGLALVLMVYPLHEHWLVPLLTAHVALLCWHPALWLFTLPLLLPVMDLAPRTGWFFLEEVDLLLLATAALCWWRLGGRPRAFSPIAAHNASPTDPHEDAYQAPPTLPPLFRASLLLLALACGCGIWRGLNGLPAIDANAWNNYLSSYNALRVGKAWCWAFIFLPPLIQTAGPRLEGIRRYLVPGVLGGLFLVALAATRERLLFPGLLNFSTDYRITAPFSAMHTGGAALDGYLALTLPLVALWLSERRSPLRTMQGLLLLPLALYAALATFSRGLYLALAVAAVLLLSLPLLGRLRRRAYDARGGVDESVSGHGDTPGKVSPRYRNALAGALGGVAMLATLNAVFASSGYRGFVAALAVLAATLLLAAQPLRPLLLTSSLVCGLALCALLAAVLPIDTPVLALLKAPYLLFICSALAFGAAFVPALTRLPGPALAPHPPGHQRPWLPLAMLGYAGLLYTAVWIALRHAGAPTVTPSAMLLSLALLPLAVNMARRRPLLQWNRRRLTGALAALLAFGLVLPIYHGYYVEERFGSVEGDLAGRVRHWRQVLAMMDDDLSTAVLGTGMGTFPATYYWRNHDGETPPAYRYLDQDGNRYLQLSGGDYAAGYGELLRMLQLVDIEPDTDYVLTLDARNTGVPAFLRLGLCQRQLLYPVNCLPLPMRSLTAAPGWRHYTFPLRSGVLGTGSFLSRAPVQLEVAVEGTRSLIDIDNISLRQVDNHRELLLNGDFTNANDHWFFSSDHHHLPWHIKNLGLNLYVEMGWPGLLAYGGLMFSAAATLLRRVSLERATWEAAAWLAGLAGFNVVGLFDSLIDVPRLTFLFLLLLCAAVLRPAPPPHSAPCQRF